MHKIKPLVDMAIHPSPTHAIVLFGLVAVIGAVAFLLTRMTAASVLALGVAAEVFSGNWKYMHIPLPLDRIIILIGLCVLRWRGSPERDTRRLLFSPIHLVMAATALYVMLSALGADTLTSSAGFYALLDRLGVIPFVMFTVAPLVFRDERGRNALLVSLVVVGAYLGVTAMAEGLGIHRLVLPSYIENPNLGIHFGRARGPFLESGADGLSMFMCGVAAAVALTIWRNRWARLLCYAVIGMSLAGGIFTLTRQVWVGDALGAVVPMMFDRRLRRRLPRILLGAVVAVVVLLVAVPGLSGKVSSRTGEASPIWDRYNTNEAALRAWVDHPITGIGWETFATKGVDYLRQADTYPETGAGLEVHNVFLSHLVELGILGALLWTVALFGGIGGAIVRRGPPELYAWRLGLMGIFACYLLSANLGPMSYPLPNLLMWMWAGIVAADRYSVLRVPDTLEETDLVSV